MEQVSPLQSDVKRLYELLGVGKRGEIKHAKSGGGRDEKKYF